MWFGVDAVLKNCFNDETRADDDPERTSPLPCRVDFALVDGDKHRHEAGGVQKVPDTRNGRSGATSIHPEPESANSPPFACPGCPHRRLDFLANRLAKAHTRADLCKREPWR